MLDGVVCVYKNMYSYIHSRVTPLIYLLSLFSLDVFVYLIASSDINEIMLFASLTTLTDALTIVYRYIIFSLLLI
jgi:hypothetical protein